jgi:sulfotransferase family protein
VPALKQNISKAARGLRGLLDPGADSTRARRTKIKPENIVWIFGNAKTGSTWLSWMMEEPKGHTAWREPYLGELFGRLYYNWDNWVGEKHFKSKHFILGEPQKKGWLSSLRSFVLNEAGARFPEVANRGYLIIKEPNGSMGAPLLMEALPESRMIFLIRDPRDVAASYVDAAKKGSYMYERRKGGRSAAMFEMQADDLVESMATSYLQNVGNAREAYEAHKGPKVLVRYEDLRSNTLQTMKGICSALGIPIKETELARAVEKHSWENIPEEEKGEGKFYRKAAPGGWREDLTPQQVETVERITAPLLKEFYEGQA